MADALAQAAAEGLELVRDPRATSGFKGVSYRKDGRNRKILVVAYFQGKQVMVAKPGECATPEEGALKYARWLRDTPGATAFRRGVHYNDGKEEMLARNDEGLRTEALRQADLEGLELVRTNGTRSGFLGVAWNASSMPYYSTRTQESFRTGEEAAVAEARFRRDRVLITTSIP